MLPSLDSIVKIYCLYSNFILVYFWRWPVRLRLPTRVLEGAYLQGMSLWNPRKSLKLRESLRRKIPRRKMLWRSLKWRMIMTMKKKIRKMPLKEMASPHCHRKMTPLEGMRHPCHGMDCEDL